MLGLQQNVLQCQGFNFSYGTPFMIVVKVVAKCHAYGGHALTIGSLINPFELVLSTRRDGRQSPNPRSLSHLRRLRHATPAGAAFHL
jgi:hypothetical protein